MGTDPFPSQRLREAIPGSFEQPSGLQSNFNGIQRLSDNNARTTSDGARGEVDQRRKHIVGTVGCLLADSRGLTHAPNESFAEIRGGQGVHAESSSARPPFTLPRIPEKIGDFPPHCPIACQRPSRRFACCAFNPISNVISRCGAGQAAARVRVSPRSVKQRRRRQPDSVLREYK